MPYMRYSDVEALRSIFHGCDAIGALVIYFCPKLLIIARGGGPRRARPRASAFNSFSNVNAARQVAKGGSSPEQTTTSA